MKGWEERKNGTGCFAGLSGDVIDMGELDFEQGHAADFCDGDPGQDNDHCHFQSELEEVGDEHAPEAADECIDSCERDQE